MFKISLKLKDLIFQIKNFTKFSAQGMRNRITLYLIIAKFKNIKNKVYIQKAIKEGSKRLKNKMNRNKNGFWFFNNHMVK